MGPEEPIWSLLLLMMMMKCFLCVLESETIICDFHRKQSWLRWCSALKNNVSEIKEEILQLFNVTTNFCCWMCNFLFLLKSGFCQEKMIMTALKAEIEIQVSHWIIMMKNLCVYVASLCVV